MRILVDINDAQLLALDALSKRQRWSRAAVIRSAIGELLAKHRSNLVADAFDLWGEHKIDGLAYLETAASGNGAADMN